MSGVVATSRTPRPRSQASTSGSDAEATGTVNTVPLLARTTLGLPQSVAGSAATTAVAPAASALRSTEPRLPGFSSPSTTTTSGSAGSVEVAQRDPRDRDDGEEPVRPLAVGDLLEGRPPAPDGRGPERPDPLDEPALLVGVEHQLGAVAGAVRGRTPASTRERELLVAVDDGQPLLLARPGVGAARRPP